MVTWLRRSRAVAYHIHVYTCTRPSRLSFSAGNIEKLGVAPVTPSQRGDLFSELHHNYIMISEFGFATWDVMKNLHYIPRPSYILLTSGTFTGMAIQLVVRRSDDLDNCPFLNSLQFINSSQAIPVPISK